MKKITVYTMDFCPYCDRVKRLLKSKGLPFEEVKLDMDDDKAWGELEKRSKMKTMPQVFIGDACVGGCTDVEALASKGELDRLVQG